MLFSKAFLLFESNSGSIVTRGTFVPPANSAKGRTLGKYSRILRTMGKLLYLGPRRIPDSSCRLNLSSINKTRSIAPHPKVDSYRSLNVMETHSVWPPGNCDRPDQGQFVFSAQTGRASRNIRFGSRIA